MSPGGSDSKESACNGGGLGSIPGLERSPGEGTGNPLQYFCFENPTDRGAWRAKVHRVAESDTTELTVHTHTPQTHKQTETSRSTQTQFVFGSKSSGRFQIFLLQK